MEPGAAVALDAAAQAFAQVFVTSGASEEAFRESAKI